MTQKRIHFYVRTLAFSGLLCAMHPGTWAQDCQLRLPSDAATHNLAQDIAKTNPCTLVPGLKVQTLAEVWKAFLRHGKTGGKRFDDPPRGIPSGTVLVRAEGLTFDLQDKWAEGVIRLNIFAGATKVVELRKPGVKVVIPAEKFQVDVSYKWQLLTGRGDYWGRMKVLDAESESTLRQRLAAVAQADVSPVIKNIYTAAIYDDAELIFDRDRIFSEMNKEK
jgi:hypothetical protein